MEKYRAWDKKYKRWYYFKLTANAHGHTINPNEPIGEITKWMQYTKNDLCEEDIIEFPCRFYDSHSSEVRQEKGVIKKDEYGFVIKKLKDGKILPLRCLEKDNFIDGVKKIGNTFEDSHLLN